MATTRISMISRMKRQRHNMLSAGHDVGSPPTSFHFPLSTFHPRHCPQIEHETRDLTRGRVHNGKLYGDCQVANEMSPSCHEPWKETLTLVARTRHVTTRNRASILPPVICQFDPCHLWLKRTKIVPWLDVWLYNADNILLPECESRIVEHIPVQLTSSGVIPYIPLAVRRQPATVLRPT